MRHKITQDDLIKVYTHALLKFGTRCNITMKCSGHLIGVEVYFLYNDTTKKVYGDLTVIFTKIDSL